ncbi:MAG: hypothetical protein ABIQ95_16765 [Bdellovibrionia bacterium]
MSTSTLEFLETYIVKSVKVGLKRYGKDGTFTISNREGAENKSTHYSDRISIILLWSNIGAITLKIHFKIETAKKLAGKIFNLPATQIADEAAMDFMRELNNIVGGGIRGDFEKNKILVGMSLPFVAQGMDEAVFKKIRDPRTTCNVQKLSNGEDEVTVSTEIYLEDAEAVERVRETLQKDLDARDNSDTDNLGDVDFF